jgi:hypothetical protein
MHTSFATEEHERVHFLIWKFVSLQDLTEFKLVLLSLFDWIPPSRPGSLMEWTDHYCVTRSLQKDWIEPWKEWRVFHIPYALTSEEAKEALNKAGWREFKHLPGRGISMISKVDGLGRLSPLHLGHGSLSIFLREAYTSQFVAAGARVRAALSQS